MMIVLDNARYHHAKLLAALLNKYAHVLTLLFLPPYSPQWAPIERVRKLTRRLATHNRYFETLGAVLDSVQRCFARWLKPNVTLKRLCGFTLVAMFSFDAQGKAQPAREAIKLAALDTV